MHRVVFDEPYEFVPPYRGRFWSWFFRGYLARHLRVTDGITAWECRGAERLRESLAAGHGILLCPNHCRPSDPLAMGIINIEAKCHSYSMASWHVFKQSRLQTFLTRRLGAFSIYREGLDRQALNTAIEIVTSGERPLIVFPEGVISRANDRLLELMDGTSFIARTAAKKRAKKDPEKQVVIHPVALRYELLGDIEAAVSPVLATIEKRLSWQPQSDADLFERICRVGSGLLSLKEIQHTGRSSDGDVYDRLEALIEHILRPLEDEWQKGLHEGTVVNRVKNIRAAVLPAMIAGAVDEAERARRWRQLADVYLAQQLSLYPRGYVEADSPPERLLETVERFEEDLTDKTTVHPLKLTIEIGEPIRVSPERPRGEADPVMTELRAQLTSMIASLGEEIARRRTVG